ncbi:MAG: SDR family oxidoreductase [Hyphomicrobium sp.]|nr:SDR family oxidoreductase [Hyphomicrobium sp.]
MATPRNATRTALVTGANRGIGFEVARMLVGEGLHVIIGARDGAKSREAAASLSKDGGKSTSVSLDVADQASVADALEEIAKTVGDIDVLVNNAGILIDAPGGFRASVFDMTDDTMRTTFETNVIGPQRLIRALVPGMRARGYGRVVNVSSMAGQLSDMMAGYPAYRMSKAALNALTRVLAAEVADTNIKVNSVCPGWCRTDMGGAGATRTAAQGADTIAWLAMLPDDGPSGLFFKDRQIIAW